MAEDLPGCEGIRVASAQDPKALAAAFDGDPTVTPERVARAIAAYERLTGETFVPGEQPVASRIQAALADF